MMVAGRAGRVFAALGSPDGRREDLVVSSANGSGLGQGEGAREGAVRAGALG